MRLSDSPQVKISAGSDSNTTMAKRIVADHCCGVIIDVQRFFLAQVDKRLRSNIVTNTKNFCPPAQPLQNPDRCNP